MDSKRVLLLEGKTTFAHAIAREKHLNGRRRERKLNLSGTLNTCVQAFHRVPGEQMITGHGKRGTRDPDQVGPAGTICSRASDVDNAPSISDKISTAGVPSTPRQQRCVTRYRTYP